MPSSKLAKNRKKNDGKGVLDAAGLHSPIEPADPEVQQEFEEAERRSGAGSRTLAKKLTEHHSQSPKLTAGDVDAAWDRSGDGEEMPGGTVATPDQAVVEEIGEAVGLTFEDDEPVDGPGKVRRRDHHRWELEPASSEDFKERQPPPVGGEGRPKKPPAPPGRSAR